MTAAVPMPANLLVESTTVHAGETLPEGRWVLLITATGRVNKSDGDTVTVELTLDLDDGVTFLMQTAAAVQQADGARTQARHGRAPDGGETTGG